MFKAYASAEPSDKKKDEEDKKPTTGVSSSSAESVWLQNRSFTVDPPLVTFAPQPTTATTATVPKPKPVIDVKPREERKPEPHILAKKSEAKDEVFYIDRRRDRANITVQYTRGVPRYGAKFCNQRPLGARIGKGNRKQRIARYFHQKLDETDARPADAFVTVDSRLEQLNIAVREQPHAFETWKELIDYQVYLFKANAQDEKLAALYNKQLAIVERAMELNANRLQYRLLRLNIRTHSHLFDYEILLNEWKTLIRDCQRSSDDRTINETWFSYMRFLFNRIEVFSIDTITDAFVQYLTTYSYHLETRSDKDRRFLLNHMLDMLQVWTCALRDAGYCERALAVYQAMLELHVELSTEKKASFAQRLDTLERTWDTSKARFGERSDVENPVSYIDNELAELSEQENRLFDSTHRSWVTIEQVRAEFYQSKILNRGLHFHSELLQSLADASQIDNETSKVPFQRFVRPFLFELHDQRQVLQLLIYYLHFLNALPSWTILQELLTKLKVSLASHLDEQLFMEHEFDRLCPLIHRHSTNRTEERFSQDYLSKVYEHLIEIPLFAPFKIDCILLYWYYLARHVVEIKPHNPSQSKLRLKSLQTIIKRYLSLEEYRTCLRLYTHYARIEHEYFHRINDSRRIFDLCFQTIRSNPGNFASYESYTDLCHWLSTSLICEFDLDHLYDQMGKVVLDNAKHASLDDRVNREKLSASIQFVLNKLFANMEFNAIISLVLECLKTRKKVSKWDQTNEKDWSTYLRQNNTLSFELLYIFLNYSYLLNDPFEKIHHIMLNSVVPLINEQHSRANQTIIDYLLLFYVAILWNELFTEHLLFSQCTNYLKRLIDSIQFPSAVLWKFTSIYTCLLPLYGSSGGELEQMLLSYKSNQKPEHRLLTKMFALQTNLMRHLKVQRAMMASKNSNSGYEHRVRHVLRQLIQEYPYYAQLWLFYEYFERHSPNNSRVKAVLYDAMQNCPWAKTLYVQSISNAVSDSEWKLFLNVMLKSNVHILFSLEEFDMLKELFEMKG